MTSEDIKHQLIIISGGVLLSVEEVKASRGQERRFAKLRCSTTTSSWQESRGKIVIIIIIITIIITIIIIIIIIINNNNNDKRYRKLVSRTL